MVTELLMQGGGEDGWVSKFSVQSSKDGIEWRSMDEDSLTTHDNALVFGGNTDGTTTIQVQEDLVLFVLRGVDFQRCILILGLYAKGM